MCGNLQCELQNVRMHVNVYSANRFTVLDFCNNPIDYLSVVAPVQMLWVTAYIQ